MGLIRGINRLRGTWLALCLIFVGLAKGLAAEVDGVALMESYCLDCHDGETQKGEVNLEAALEAKPLVKNLDLWKTVISRVENGDMPPKKKDQPSSREKKALLEWLDREVVQFDYSTVEDPGYEPVRRLTHIEFSNTIRDLLGLDMNQVLFLQNYHHIRHHPNRPIASHHLEMHHIRLPIRLHQNQDNQCRIEYYFLPSLRNYLNYLLLRHHLNQTIHLDRLGKHLDYFHLGYLQIRHHHCRYRMLASPLHLFLHCNCCRFHRIFLLRCYSPMRSDRRSLHPLGSHRHPGRR